MIQSEYSWELNNIPLDFTLFFQKVCYSSRKTTHPHTHKQLALGIFINDVTHLGWMGVCTFVKLSIKVLVICHLDSYSERGEGGCQI